MDLGVFSLSLSVADLAVSRDFYAKLGFDHLGGDPAQGYLILKNGDTVIGLFQGMFEGNILTFNPGWDSSAQEVDPFTDVRDLQRALKESGVSLTVEADEATTGPGHFILSDPDGNVIMVDQHR